MYACNWLIDKKKTISNENLGVDYYLLLKYCTRQCTLLPLSGPNKSLTIKIQQQIAGLSTCYGLKLQEKRRIEQFNFFGFAFKYYKFSCFKWL